MQAQYMLPCAPCKCGLVCLDCNRYSPAACPTCSFLQSRIHTLLLTRTTAAGPHKLCIAEAIGIILCLHGLTGRSVVAGAGAPVCTPGCCVWLAQAACASISACIEQPCSRSVIQQDDNIE